MNKRVLFGWILISLALAISAYANFNCSFSCQGIWGQVYNPLTIIGLVLYAAGTYLLLAKKRRK
ncbi:MAG TPA: hypothetical protein VMC80_00185 [Patescibacteria group bacterium]|nr:hypothetical protein [Patescibacteria group bacterium]